MTVYVIVARYREDLRWLDTLPDSYRVIIADKGTDGGSGIIVKKSPSRANAVIARKALPNVGKDQHSLLTIIAAIHHCLRPDDIVVCCQGRIDDHADSYGMEWIEPSAFVDRMVREAQTWSHSKNHIVWTGPMAPHPLFKVSIAYPGEKDSGMTFGDFFTRYIRPGESFPGYTTTSTPSTEPDNFRWYKNAIFAVRAEHILNVSVERFCAIVAMLDAPDCEATHYMERSWFYLLGLDRRKSLHYA